MDCSLGFDIELGRHQLVEGCTPVSWNRNGSDLSRKPRCPTHRIVYADGAWAQTSKLGCAIAECSTDYVVICRYSPRGNNVGESVYKVGEPCSACLGSCDAGQGLCEGE
ncbi:unnamed protein product [Cylicocyclus nassatus]|uniref:SCP domain-containing protein n=1 Tax=Cylicocyclus nassatus TaxID=53992 RepID=A0AA36M9D8_CYLNA|nr:unnamed protein product [Cylicocyclus nassatus]